MKSPSTPTRKFHLSLMVLLFLNMMPHLEEHLLITTSIGGLALIWRWLYEFQKVRLPPFPIKLALVIASFYFVYHLHGKITGADAATALLIAGVSLKLLDSSSYHDAMVILFLNFLLLMSRFLVSQSLPMTLLGVLNLIIITALLVQLHKGRDLQLNFKSLLKLGLKLSLQTAPLLVLLFFVFPRFSTGFFNLNPETQAKTGFSGKLNPGEVSRLVVSDEVAFRVEFAEKVPSPNQRYWRGAILKMNNGMTWEVGSLSSQLNAKYFKKKRSENTVTQNIFLEPRYGTWLFALENPLELHFKDTLKQYQSYIQEESVYRIKQNNSQKITYRVLSDLNPSRNSSDLEEYLQIEKEDNAQLKSWIQEVTTTSSNDIEIKEKYLEYFRKNLRYTLQPPPLTENKVSEFLFQTQRGFCEHMAGSFAYLLRASGIPARVIVGFQGGSKNDLGEHFVVKEKDAHAWVEMWSQSQQQWLRVDPTEVVAPLRLELGGQVFHSLSEEELNLGLSQDEYLNRYRSTWYYKIFGQGQLAFDLASMKWNQFLLNFDREGQKDFLQKLGLGRLKQKHLILLTIIALVIFFLWLNRQRYFLGRREKLESKMYRELCKFLEEKGLPKAIHYGPRTYLKHCQKRWPALEKKLNAFLEIYTYAAYSSQEASEESKEQLQVLLRDIKKEFPKL